MKCCGKEMEQVFYKAELCRACGNLTNEDKLRLRRSPGQDRRRLLLDRLLSNIFETSDSPSIALNKIYALREDLTDAAEFVANEEKKLKENKYND